MTKKDFELIARIISSYDKVHGGIKVRIPLAYHFASKLSEKYPNFNPDKFVNAAGSDTPTKRELR